MEESEVRGSYVSIILLTYRRGARTAVSQKCLKALLDNTNYPYELIVVDNTFNNRGLSEGRNLGLDMATGEYVCIIDDDIYVYPGWLEMCIKILKRCGRNKYLVTPIIQRLIKKWELPTVNGYRCNSRTGSNCMIGKREIFDKVGLFPDFKKTRGLAYESAKVGKVYANWIHKRGYLFLLPRQALAKDLGVNKHSYL